MLGCSVDKMCKNSVSRHHPGFGPVALLVSIGGILSSIWCLSLIPIIEPAAPPSPAPPGAAEGLGERAEGGQGGRPLVRELWFIVVMAAVALLLLAVVLGALLHKVRKEQSTRSLWWGDKQVGPSFVCCRCWINPPTPGRDPRWWACPCRRGAPRPFTRPATLFWWGPVEGSSCPSALSVIMKPPSLPPSLTLCPTRRAWTAAWRSKASAWGWR